MIDDDDKTEVTGWSAHFDKSDKGYQSKTVADSQIKRAGWLKKVVQQLSGNDEIWGIQCEFCGQYESSETKIQRLGIRLVPICSECIKFDR